MINTQGDWWASVDLHWSNLLQCFANAGAELSSRFWCDGPGLPVVDHPKSMASTLEDARAARDWQYLRKMFGLCWMAAPDRPKIHAWPSWHVLCDLCSEDWVFYEDDGMVVAGGAA